MMDAPAANASEGLRSAVRGVFLPGGALARPGADHAFVDAQLAMAEAVVETLIFGGRLVVEAETGVGKTWAYLVPLLLSGSKAWISTATQALQEQLVQRDVPALVKALGMPVRVAMLKGRNSYVCLHRVDLAVAGELEMGRHDPAWASALNRVRAWANQSPNGDLAEIHGLADDSPLRPWISSTQDNCLSRRCPRWSDCHVDRARRRAQEADWVVINHHLFLADPLTRDDTLPAMLPNVPTVVFDEAHRLVELSETQLGLSMGSAQLGALAREIRSLGPLLARGMQPWGQLALRLEQAARLVADALPARATHRGPLRWGPHAPEGVTRSSWMHARLEVFNVMTAAVNALQSVAGAAEPLSALTAQATRLQGVWLEILRDRPTAQDDLSGWHRWIDQGAMGDWRVVQSCVDAAQAFRSAMGSAAMARSWVFTSATLGLDDRLGWFTEHLGLDASPDLSTLRIASPFNHAQQASLYVPHELPEPGDERHSTLLAGQVAQWAEVLGGRTLVLTTSLRACERIAQTLRSQLDLCGSPLEVLVQGEAPKGRLLERFRLAIEGSRGSVMVASSSFWEGVDLPGDALQLLVIDKVPFPSPGDPMTQARAMRASARGEDGFDAGYLNKAAMGLRQGAGRLIRRASDQGILVIGDRRLLTQAYGVRLLQALPPMRRLYDADEMHEALVRLASSR
jgi:ATP-dependent DNA helicase DinG